MQRNTTEESVSVVHVEYTDTSTMYACSARILLQLNRMKNIKDHTIRRVSKFI